MPCFCALAIVLAGCHKDDDQAQTAAPSPSPTSQSSTTTIPTQSTGTTPSPSTGTTPSPPPPASRGAAAGVWTGFISPECFPEDGMAADCVCCPPPTVPPMGRPCRLGQCSQIVASGTNMTLTLSQSGSVVSGTYATPDVHGNASGSVQGNQLTIALQSPELSCALPMTGTGALNGNQMTLTLHRDPALINTSFPSCQWMWPLDGTGFLSRSTTSTSSTLNF
jgi:hypothetical protein